MNRREMLLSTAAGLSASILGRSALAVDSPRKRTGMGLVIYCLGIRNRAERAAGNKDFFEPAKFLEHCHRLGAGGMQVPLGVRDDAYTTALRRRAEQLGMHVEGIMGLPGNEADRDRFEAEVRTAKRAGADVARVVIIPGRRYERFTSLAEFREFARRGVRTLELAEPIARKHGLRLAVENHKDQRVPERLELFKRLSSEYIGACVDVGNSFSLLEDPIEVIEAYAPWALTVHLKDQAVQETPDGFLFADAALGDGFLDLARMVAILRKANPRIRFNLETITRDPLKVPCLAESYWATFPDVPARELARTLGIVRAHSSADLLPQAVSHLSQDEQVKREAENVVRSLRYAGDELQI